MGWKSPVCPPIEVHTQAGSTVLRDLYACQFYVCMTSSAIFHIVTVFLYYVSCQSDGDLQIGNSSLLFPHDFNSNYCLSQFDISQIRNRKTPKGELCLLSSSINHLMTAQINLPAPQFG